MTLKLTGQRFGKLVVLSRSTGYVSPKGNKRSTWFCECDCGNSTVVNGSALESGRTKSCGCLIRDIASKNFTKYGHTSNPRYPVWRDMIRRCYDTNHPSYSNYGGRGITVCEEWRDEEFGILRYIEDMGDRPTGDYSVDRINNDGNYGPFNCRWATRSEQNLNRRDRCIV